MVVQRENDNRFAASCQQRATTNAFNQVVLDCACYGHQPARLGYRPVRRAPAGIRRSVRVRSRLPFVVLGLLLVNQIFNPARIWVGIMLGLGALLLLCYVWARALRDGLDAQRTLRGAWVLAGDTLSELFTVENRSGMPALWVEVLDHSDLPGYRPDWVAYVEVNGRQSYRTEGRCQRRGVFTLGPWELRSGDPLGIFETQVEYPDVRSILVYPRAMVLPDLRLPRGIAPGPARTQRRSNQTTTTVATVRPYAPGDPLRAIHWRQTARQGEFMVKQFDIEPSGDLWIVLDLDAAVQAGEGAVSTLEYAITLIASLATQMLAENRRVGSGRARLPGAAPERPASALAHPGGAGPGRGHARLRPGPPAATTCARSAAAAARSWPSPRPPTRPGAASCCIWPGRATRRPRCCWTRPASCPTMTRSVQERAERAGRPARPVGPARRGQPPDRPQLRLPSRGRDHPHPHRTAHPVSLRPRHRRRGGGGAVAMETLLRLLHRWRPAEGWLLWMLALVTVLLVAVGGRRGRLGAASGPAAQRRDHRRLYGQLLAQPGRPAQPARRRDCTPTAAVRPGGRSRCWPAGRAGGVAAGGLAGGAAGRGRHALAAGAVGCGPVWRWSRWPSGWSSGSATCARPAGQRQRRRTPSFAGCWA